MTKNNKGKIILDACCGGRMFWFDKNNPLVLFQDAQKSKKNLLPDWPMYGKFLVCPDVKGDFRKMKFKNNTFKLVVFDPPHLLGNEKQDKKSWMKRKYGFLNKETYREDLRRGFSECFRVLKNEGILIFKWFEFTETLNNILALCPYNPLFGHRSGKQQKTHWVCFMKIKDMKK